jgi:hypothetical protein
MQYLVQTKIVKHEIPIDNPRKLTQVGEIAK